LLLLGYRALKAATEFAMNLNSAVGVRKGEGKWIAKSVFYSYPIAPEHGRDI